MSLASITFLYMDLSVALDSNSFLLACWMQPEGSWILKSKCMEYTSISDTSFTSLKYFGYFLDSDALLSVVNPKLTMFKHVGQKSWSCAVIPVQLIDLQDGMISFYLSEEVGRCGITTESFGEPPLLAALPGKQESLFTYGTHLRCRICFCSSSPKRLPGGSLKLNNLSSSS